MAIDVHDPSSLMPWRSCQVLCACPLTGQLALRPGEGLILEGVIYRRVHTPEAAMSPDALERMTQHLHMCQLADLLLQLADGPSPSAGASPSGGREGEKTTADKRLSISPEPLTLWSV